MGPKRKSMEDEEEGKNKTNATDSAVKRPRMLTKRFTFNEAFIEGTSTGSRKRTSIGSTKELLYSPDTIIAVRAEKDTFYLCETVRNVYNTSGKFNIRWLEVEEAPYKYRRAYNDNIRLECVLTSVKMSKVPKEKKCFMISKEEIARIQKLLKASVTGQDVLSLDKDLFEPVSKKSRAVADADKDDDTDTGSSLPETPSQSMFWCKEEYTEEDQDYGGNTYLLVRSNGNDAADGSRQHMLHMHEQMQSLCNAEVPEESAITAEPENTSSQSPRRKRGRPRKIQSSDSHSPEEDIDIKIKNTQLAVLQAELNKVKAEKEKIELEKIKLNLEIVKLKSLI